MDLSDISKPVMDILMFEEHSNTKFFVLRKSDGKQ